MEKQPQTPHNAQMIYSPIKRIPIGVPIKKPNGKYILQVKKSNRGVVEDVPVEYLLEQIYQGNDGAK